MARGNTAVDVRYMRRAYFEHCITNGIHSDEQLIDFNEIYYGVRLVNRRSPHCPHHHPPARFVTDQFFDRVQSCLGFANRLGGKTLEVGILNVNDMLFKPGVEICSAGAVIAQGKKGYEYVFDGFRKMADVLNAPASPVRVANFDSQSITLSNNSRAKLLTLNWTGVNSQHPHRWRVDEVELAPFPYIQESLSMTQSSNGIKAQDTLTSTRKVSTGTMQKLIDQADERGMTIIQWCIWETLKTCTRKCKGDPDFGDCPAYSRRNAEGEDELLCGNGDGTGKAQELPPGGWFEVDDFIKKVQNLDRATFEAQWLCLRPNQLQIVYGSCYRDEAPYVTTEAEEEEILRRYRAHPESWTRIYGQDFGSNWWCGELIQDPQDGVWYVIWEYFWAADRDRTVATHAGYLKGHDPLGFSADGFFGYADPAGRQMIADLEEYDIFFQPANNAVVEGVQYVKTLFEKFTPAKIPSLRVFRRCKELRRELCQTYLHPQARDGELQRDRYVKRDDHACDGLRYALYSHHTIGTASYSRVTLRGL